MKRNISKILPGIFAAFVLLFIVGSADAQRRESRGRLLTKAQVKAVINRVETRVDNFVGNFDRSLDRSRLNGSNKEDRLNRKAKDLEKATDELKRQFDIRDAWIENKDEVRKCLNIASDIDRQMRNYRFGRPTEANWARVRFELNSLADVYNLPRVAAITYN